MERDTTKHGPRLDEALKQEIRSLEQGGSDESRAEPWLTHEAPERPAQDDVEARRRLSAHLRLSVFPAERDALVAEAREQRAPDDLVLSLQALPAGRAYATVYEVHAELAGLPDVEEAARHDAVAARRVDVSESDVGDTTTS
jgi:hypothetical protein